MKKLVICLSILTGILAFGATSALAIFVFENANANTEQGIHLDDFDSFFRKKIIFDPGTLSWSGDSAPRVEYVNYQSQFEISLLPTNPSGDFFDDVFFGWGIDGIPFDFDSTIQDHLYLTPVFQMQTIMFDNIEYSFHPDQQEVAVTGADESIVSASIVGSLDGFPISRVLSGAFFAKENLEFVDIASSISLIDAYSFSQSPNLSSIVLREGLQRIGDSAFADCVSLGNGQMIVLPSSVEYVGSEAFGHIENLMIDVSFVDQSLLEEFAPDWNGIAIVLNDKL